jgi:hypothetical protein
MTRSLSFLLLAALFVSSGAAQTVTLPQASPAASVTQRFGLTDVTVEYCRPGVREREIWGELVPWGFVPVGFGTTEAAPWRAGANENTVFTCSTDILVEGVPLPAGSYGFFLALDPSGEVTAIFSRNHSSWGSFHYDPAEDVLRVKVRWEDAPFQELLTYAFTDVTEESATLALLWEHKRIPLRLSARTPEIVMASLKRELRGSKGFVNRSWLNAARYALQHNIELGTALAWVENALTGPFIGQETFAGYELKAQILEQLGRPGEAEAVMRRAVEFGTVFDLHNYGRQLIADGEPGRALDIFLRNARENPGEWPVNYGLARGYSALGRFDEAIRHLEQALLEIPPGDTFNAPAMAENLAALKRGEDIN